MITALLAEFERDKAEERQGKWREDGGRVRETRRETRAVTVVKT